MLWFRQAATWLSYLFSFMSLRAYHHGLASRSTRGIHATCSDGMAFNVSSSHLVLMCSHCMHGAAQCKACITSLLKCFTWTACLVHALTSSRGMRACRLRPVRLPKPWRQPSVCMSPHLPRSRLNQKQPLPLLHLCHPSPHLQQLSPRTAQLHPQLQWSQLPGPPPLMWQ